MATWEDLDSRFESNKDDADEDAKVVVELVATVTLEAKPELDSEEENEKCLREKEKQKSWYLDSGCSRHMTGEKSMFLTLTMKEGGNVSLEATSLARSLVQELLVTPLSLLIMCGW